MKNRGKIAITSLILIVLHTVLYYAFNAKVLPSARQEKQFEALVNRTTTLDYLFVGNSHTVRGIDTNQIPNSFSFGVTAENSVFTYYRLRKAFSEMKVLPKTLIVPIDYGSYSYGVERVRKHNFHYLDKIDLEEWNEISNNTFDNEKWYWIHKIFPYTEAKRIIQDTDKKKKKKNEKQFGQLSSSSKQNIANRFIANQYQLERNECVYSECVKTYFSKYRKLADEYGLDLIYLDYPVTDSYRKAFDKYMEKNEEHKSEVDDLYELAHSLDENAVILKLSDFFAGDESKFHDLHHLNAKGRTELSSFLNKELKALNFTPN